MKRSPRIRIIVRGPLLALVWATTALAGPVIDVFRLPAANSRPVGITVAEDGSIWFTDSGIDAVGRLTEDGALTMLALPSPSGPAGIVSDGRGSIWFAQNDRNAIGRYGAAPPHALEEFFLPEAASQPFAIAVGAGGDVWFTEIGGNRIGRIDANRTITEYPIPTQLAVPAGIAVASDGGVWFTEFNRNQIGRLDPDGTFMEMPLPHAGSGPFGIVVDGHDTVFFTQLNGNRIGRIAEDALYAEIAIPTASSQPAGIAVGDDSTVWFTQIAADRIGALIGTRIHEIDIAAGSFEGGTLFGGGIAAEPDGDLVFAAGAAAAIDRLRLCASNADCPTGNCERAPRVCGPRLAHTPTPPVPFICSSNADCAEDFFCNEAEGRLCCNMQQCPPGWSCRIPNHEGFCSQLPLTSTPAPPATATASASATLTLQPTSTRTATESPTLAHPPASTPRGGGSSGGCHLSPTSQVSHWVWLLIIATLHAVHRKR